MILPTLLTGEQLQSIKLHIKKEFNREENDTYAKLFFRKFKQFIKGEEAKEKEKLINQLLSTK